MAVDLQTLENLRGELLAFQSSARKLFNRRAARLHPGLAAPAVAVLRRIDTYGPQPADDLAARLGIDASVVSRQVGALERAGLIKRVPDPTDQHRQLLALTQEGQRGCGEISQAGVRHLGAALADWKAEDLDAFTRLLRRFNAAN